MSTTPLPLLRILPYLGAIPFVLGLMLQLMGYDMLIYFLATQRVVLSYALAIVCFMAGAVWGQSVAGLPLKYPMLIASNVITLVAWAAYLYLTPRTMGLLYAALFAILYLIDTRFPLPPHYLKTRRNVTLIVCACLVAISFA